MAAGLIAGCGDSDSTGTDGAVIPVTVSTTQLGDLTRNIGGDRVEVNQILSASSDPHDFEPTPSDVESLTGAELIIKSGGDLDEWLDQLIESAGTDAPVLTVIDGVETRMLDDEVDPHWWQDPANAMTAVGEIRDALVEIDPAGAEAYEANAAEYKAKLGDLDAQIAGCMDRVPDRERKLVTSHDALGYFADRYGIEVVGAVIPALSTQAQASAGETAELVELIEDTGVKAIFPEAGVSAQIEDQISAATGADVGGELWADTLGPEGSNGATYLDATAANTAALVSGFSGGRQSCEIDVTALSD